MFDHLEFEVSRIDASENFYTSALRPLGWIRLHADLLRGVVGYGPEDGPIALMISAQSGVRTQKPLHLHIAFCASTTDKIAEFYRCAIAGGGVCNGAPGLRLAYGPDYYAAFVLDPDGHNIEVVFRRDNTARSRVRSAA